MQILNKPFKVSASHHSVQLVLQDIPTHISTVSRPFQSFLGKAFNLYSECLTKEALEGFGDFKIGGQIIQTVRYADDLVLLAKEEKVLQDD